MRIAVPIIAQTVDEARRDMDRAAKQGADIIEVRFDYLRREEQTSKNLASLLKHNNLPKIYTNRHISQTGCDSRAGFRGSEEERLELCQAAADSNVRYIDTEFGRDLKWHGTPIHILSYHDFNWTLPYEKLKRTAKSMLKSVRYTTPGIIKIATKAVNYSDNLRMLRLTEDMIMYRGGPKSIQFIGLCMGECGIPTRVLGPSHGSYLTFASLDGKASAPGQLSIKELKKAAELLQLTSS